MIRSGVSERRIMSALSRELCERGALRLGTSAEPVAWLHTWFIPRLSEHGAIRIADSEYKAPTAPAVWPALFEFQRSEGGR